MSNCSGCGAQSYCHSAEAGCQAARAEQWLPLAEGASVQKVIGVMGARGGVGTTLITASLAAGLQAADYRVGVIDANIWAADLAQVLGASGPVRMQDDVFDPQITASGIQVMSFAGFMSDPGEPVLWDAAMMSGVCEQFWTATRWDRVDVLLVDLPAGGGDVVLNVLQHLPLETVLLVTTAEPDTLSRAEQARNFLDWSQVRCGGLLVNLGGTRGEAGRTEVAATRMGLPQLDAVGRLTQASEPGGCAEAAARTRLEETFPRTAALIRRLTEQTDA